jgi:histidine triad (HIT) family protein
MSGMTAYDPNNIFAKILRGEIPNHTVFEDERTLAFMDIMPIVDGHCLVIPKKPARNIFDVDPGELGYLAQVAQKVSIAACTAFVPLA